jgi:hypothetical protein
MRRLARPRQHRTGRVHHADVSLFHRNVQTDNLSNGHAPARPLRGCSHADPAPWTRRVTTRDCGHVPDFGPPSAREMTIDQGSPSPKRADRGRVATYRAGLRLNLWSVAPCATVVGNRQSRLGNPG